MSEGAELEHVIEAEGFSLDSIDPRVTADKIAEIVAVNDPEKIRTRSAVLPIRRCLSSGDPPPTAYMA